MQVVSFQVASHGLDTRIFVPQMRRLMPTAASLEKFVFHAHDFIELVYVVRGSGSQKIDERAYPIISGDLYVLPVGSEHSLKPTAGVQTQYYDILFQPELFDEQEWRRLRALPRFSALFPTPALGAAHAAATKLTFGPPRSDELERLAARMCAECGAREPGWQMVVKGLFTDLLVSTCRQADQSVSEAASGHEGPVARALAMLHERFAERIALDDLAAQAGVSAGYLGELFKERTGESVHRYLMRLRIERARALIAQSDRSFTDIALSCGFEDSSYFARVFRQVMGISPREFKRSLASGAARSR